MLSSWDHSKENPIEFNYSLDGKFIARASSTMYFQLSWQLGVCFPVPLQFTFYYISLAYPRGMMFLLRLPENVGSELTSLFLAKEASFPRISCPVSCWKKSVRRTVMASSIKLLLAIRILCYSLAVNLLILPNNVSLNPGPTGPSLHSSFSSSSSFDSSIALENCNDISSHFDLGSDDKGLRIGHWNVNRLSSEKFDQIKLFLIGKSGHAQVDILFLTETLLKPDIPDVLYAVPGFSIYRHDRVSRCGGGVLVFVNDQPKLKRQDDLENLDLEVIWLEVFPIKSKRSLFISGIYCPPWYSLADDFRLEKNIEQAYLLSKEPILLGD